MISILVEFSDEEGIERRVLDTLPEGTRETEVLIDRLRLIADRFEGYLALKRSIEEI